MLSEKGPQPWHPAPAELKSFVAAVVAKWQARGVSLAKLSLQQSLANPAIATTICGMASLAELENSLSALADPVDPELLALVRADFAPVYNTTWSQGRPENN
jgi:L-galactose dehydrogenase